MSPQGTRPHLQLGSRGAEAGTPDLRKRLDGMNPAVRFPNTLISPSGSRKGTVSSQAAYLQRVGVNTVVFERRHVIGGAAVTEEIIPGELQEVVGEGGDDDHW